MERVYVRRAIVLADGQRLAVTWLIRNHDSTANSHQPPDMAG